jgi:hypothetical protein
MYILIARYQYIVLSFKDNYHKESVTSSAYTFQTSSKTKYSISPLFLIGIIAIRLEPRPNTSSCLMRSCFFPSQLLLLWFKSILVSKFDLQKSKLWHNYNPILG